MANSYDVTRTNYFHVKDEEAFLALMERVYCPEDSVQVYKDQDKEGKPVFMFGCYDSISGLRNSKDDEDEDADESSYDEFIEALQACVAEDDAIIIYQSGHEKLRCVFGDYTIVTSTEYVYRTMESMACQEAKQLLKNPEWETKSSY